MHSRSFYVLDLSGLAWVYRTVNNPYAQRQRHERRGKLFTVACNLPHRPDCLFTKMERQ